MEGLKVVGTRRELSRCGRPTNVETKRLGQMMKRLDRGKHTQQQSLVSLRGVKRERQAAIGRACRSGRKTAKGSAPRGWSGWAL